ncbi:MAG TPA: aldo/keto reductase [Rhizomicrobium sp.]|jgi:aryl-alcohol dehydrogenase-like predicted oxidoreductase
MQTAMLGPVGAVSRLTLGGGGIGQIWGETSRDEAKATIRHALDRGITLIDTAPMYGNCEAIVGETFGGMLPADVRITTKCQLGTPPAGEAKKRLTASLDASLAAMKLERVDIFFLHSNICEDGYVYRRHNERQNLFATQWSVYVGEVIPAMEALKAEGKIAHWGITGTGVPRTIVKALQHTSRPAAVQAVANLLDSAGSMKSYAEPEEPRTIIAAAVANKVGVLGIRAVQAGALTEAIDRTLSPNNPDTKDYERAAPFRSLCREMGEDPALVAHRYALGMAGVDTVILGVKNRAELDQCLEAEARGPLEPAVITRIEALGLRPAAA